MAVASEEIAVAHRIIRSSC